MNIAVILAGGSGTRLGGDRPKQFLEVAGRKILEYTVDAFERNQHIDEIAIVTRLDLVDEVRRLVEQNRYAKVKKILCGGKERYHSSLAAINAYTDDAANLILHDGVRPMVTDRIIDDCVAALERHGAVGVAMRTTDTIWQVDDEGFVAAIPQRSSLRNAQTPQCFRRGVIRQAYERALQDPLFTTTDDCGVVQHYLPEEKIFVVEGETTNIKVTYREDLVLLERLLRG